MYRYTKKSLLDVAIEQGQPEAVKCLLDLGEPIDRVNLQGKSPLHLATLHGQAKIVEYLLTKGADCNCLTLPITDCFDNSSAVNEPIETYNQTALHLAIISGNESIVQCLLNHMNTQSKVNQRDANNYDTQLETGLEIENSEGLTAINLARKLNTPFIKSLLEAQVIKNGSDGEQQLTTSTDIGTIKYSEVTVNSLVPIQSSSLSSGPSAFVLGKLNFQEKIVRIDEELEEEDGKNEMNVQKEQENEMAIRMGMGIEEEKEVEMMKATKMTDRKENVKKDQFNTISCTQQPIKLIQRRDPFSRLLNLHLRMKSDDEIRYDSKLTRNSSPPSGYSGRRKVSFVTEYFEKIELRRDSLYRTVSNWPCSNNSPILDKNGNNILDNNNNNDNDNNNNNIKGSGLIDDPVQNQSSESLSIHEAATNGVIEVIALHLVQQRTAIDMIDTDGNTPLLYASRAGQSGAVKYLLSKGANVKCKNSEGRNALHMACFSGNEETLRQLILLEGIDLEVKDNEKNTPLIIASSLGHLRLVQLLTFSGAQVNVKNARKQTPIHKAAFNGFTDVLEHLVVKGGQVNVFDSEKDTPLHLAAHKGHIETVKILLEYGASTDEKNSLKRRPIHEAAYSGSVEVLNLLLKRKIKLDARDKNGDTALNLAAAQGHVKIMELLLQAGARINPKKDKTNSALHMATINEHIETLELLLSCKAAIAVRDKKSDTPLHFACSQGNALIVQTLLNCGAPVNVKGSFGRTPLHLAVLNEQTKVISLLLEKGADKTIKDSDGKTALHYAKLKSYSEAISELTG